MQVERLESELVALSPPFQNSFNSDDGLRGRNPLFDQEFNMMDVNQDGVIDRHEFQAHFGKLQASVGQSVSHAKSKRQVFGLSEWVMCRDTPICSSVTFVVSIATDLEGAASSEAHSTGIAPAFTQRMSLIVVLAAGILQPGTMAERDCNPGQDAHTAERSGQAIEANHKNCD